MALLILIATGCAKHELMPTPNLYINAAENPFADVPQELRNNKIEVLYITDRTATENSTREKADYGSGRSSSLAFGKCMFSIGKDLTWEELEQASRSRKRSVKLPVTLDSVQELIRFPNSPERFIPPSDGGPMESPTWIAANQEAQEDFRSQMAKVMASRPNKEVFLYIHGVANDFKGSAGVIAELWHFFGRQGVPMVYSWPTGGSGLRFYFHDSTAGEFTVYHLKQFLRLLASCPDVERINILAHSRGTAVLTTAAREMHIEARAAGKDSRQLYKLGTIVLAAADMDMDVVVQRLATERVGFISQRNAIYICYDDKALAFSTWLTGGMMRLGRLRADFLSQQDQESLRTSTIMQIIDARVSKAGSFGHNYFYQNPAVSSDLILLFRDGRAPGTEHGRPLKRLESGFWLIEDSYPAQPNDNADNATATR